MRSADPLTLARADTVTRLLEQSLVARELDETRNYLSRDFTLNMPMFLALPSGPSAWTQAMKFLLTGLSEIGLQIGDSFGDDEYLALHFTVEGRHTGPLGRIGATHASVRVRGLSLWKFRRTSVCEATIELGLWESLGQLGAVRLKSSVVLTDA